MPKTTPETIREIGGYIELDTYSGRMLHEGAVALNCGRSCLAYLIEAKQIKKLLLPYFMCDSVLQLCEKYHVQMRFYHIGRDLLPVGAVPAADEWLYVMNYYGQLPEGYPAQLKAQYGRVIADYAQAYFLPPEAGVDTLYTCRKFFGVADGAFLYTDCAPARAYGTDESFDRMRFLLGRYERTASEFYAEYSANNHRFAEAPVLYMSRLTANLLHAVDYDAVKRRRTENFAQYHAALGAVNQLSLRETEGAFAYPLLVENGAELRAALQQKKIYIPTLWPNVVHDNPADSTEYDMAKNILPLPCDQRYGAEEIAYVTAQIMAGA